MEESDGKRCRRSARLCARFWSVSVLSPMAPRLRIPDAITDKARYLRAAAISVALDRHPTSEAKRHVQSQRRQLPWPQREDRTYEPIAADRAAADHAVGAARRTA